MLWCCTRERLEAIECFGVTLANTWKQLKVTIWASLKEKALAARTAKWSVQRAIWANLQCMKGYGALRVSGKSRKLTGVENASKNKKMFHSSIHLMWSVCAPKRASLVSRRAPNAFGNGRAASWLPSWPSLPSRLWAW